MAGNQGQLDENLYNTIAVVGHRLDMSAQRYCDQEDLCVREYRASTSLALRKVPQTVRAAENKSGRMFSIDGLGCINRLNCTCRSFGPPFSVLSFTHCLLGGRMFPSVTDCCS